MKEPTFTCGQCRFFRQRPEWRWGWCAFTLSEPTPQWMRIPEGGALGRNTPADECDTFTPIISTSVENKSK